MADPDELCRRLALRQRGLVTRKQAHTAGHSDGQIQRRVRGGEWRQTYPGIFAIGGAPGTTEQALLGVCMWAGNGSAVSHRAAAALLGLDGLEPCIIEISSTLKRRRPAGGVILHPVDRLDGLDITRKDGIPVTTVLRTLADIGAVVDRERVEIALDFALRRRMTTVDQLFRHLDRLGGHGRNGAGVLRQILIARERLPTESTLERRFLALVRKAPVPLPETQVRVGLPGGRYRLDFVWKSRMVIVETEGYDSHSGRMAWDRDRQRRNELTLQGWRVFHFTWWEVTRNPDKVMAVLIEALGE